MISIILVSMFLAANGMNVCISEDGTMKLMCQLEKYSVVGVSWNFNNSALIYIDILDSTVEKAYGSTDMITVGVKGHAVSSTLSLSAWGQERVGIYECAFRSPGTDQLTRDTLLVGLRNHPYCLDVEVPYPVQCLLIIGMSLAILLVILAHKVVIKKRYGSMQDLVFSVDRITCRM